MARPLSNTETLEHESDDVPNNPQSKTRHYLCSPIRVDLFAELQLLLLTVCTGIQDATTFPDYRCFASNQTGNTIFLTIAAFRQKRETGQLFDLVNITIALLLFLAGGLVTGQLGHLVGPRKRLWLLATNLFQTCLVFGAAASQYRCGVQETGSRAQGTLALLAFAAGSQVVQSRSLALTEISTAMATAAWVDLLIDPHLFLSDNRSRNRRIAFLLALVIGGFVGAKVLSSLGSAHAIMISAVGKLIVTFMYFFSRTAEVKATVNRLV